MNRYLIGVLAVLVALPLFAFPLVSPVSQGSQQLRLDTDPFGSEINSSEYEPRVNYSSLSTDAQELFDRARNSDSGGVRVDAESAPTQWRERAENQTVRALLVYGTDDGGNYMTYTDLYTPGPDGADVLTRLGSLVASILIGISGAYLIYQHRGVE